MGYVPGSAKSTFVVKAIEPGTCYRVGSDSDCLEVDRQIEARYSPAATR